MSKFIAIVLIIGVIVMIYIYFIMPQNATAPTINSFEECVKAGNSVLQSYPPRCLVKGGQSFTQDIGNELEKVDLIRIDNPRPNQVISSPLKISGQAKGTWFFEGDLPIKLLDEDNNILAEGFVTAQGEWMSENFVPFETEINFVMPNTTKGTLILSKNNPSGLAKNDDQLIVPVKFK